MEEEGDDSRDLVYSRRLLRIPLFFLFGEFPSLSIAVVVVVAAASSIGQGTLPRIASPTADWCSISLCSLMPEADEEAAETATPELISVAKHLQDSRISPWRRRRRCV